MSYFAEILTRLSKTIQSRVGADPTTSYTAKLLAGGPPLAAKKFGEEAVETALAAVQNQPDQVAAESADMLYHWLVLLAATGVSLDDVAKTLAAREGVSGIAEKAARPKG